MTQQLSETLGDPDWGPSSTSKLFVSPISKRVVPYFRTPKPRSTAEASSARFVPLSLSRSVHTRLGFVSPRHVPSHPSFRGFPFAPVGFGGSAGWSLGSADVRWVPPGGLHSILFDRRRPSKAGVGDVGEAVAGGRTSTVEPSELSTTNPSKCGWNERRRVETAWTWRTCLPSQTVECDMLEAVGA